MDAGETEPGKLRLSLIEPLGLPEGVRRLLVAPHRRLAFVPFCLLTEREVAHVPSGTAYALLRKAGAGERGERVLALGDPQYGTAKETATIALLRGSALAPLPATRAEARAIGDTLLLGPEATVASLRVRLGSRPRWRAVHLACHGLIDPERAMESPLALTPAGQDDGFLMTAEVLSAR